MPERNAREANIWLPGREGLRVPDPKRYFTPGEGESARSMMAFFRALFAGNGMNTALAPREDTIELPATEAPGHGEPLQLRSSFRGMDMAQRLARQNALIRYRAEKRTLEPTVKIQPGTRPRTADARLESYIEDIPDVGGSWGVETYALLLPEQSGTLPERLKAGRGFLVHRSHNLEAEAAQYGLPYLRGNAAAYPYRGADEHQKCYAFVDGKPLYELRDESAEDPYGQVHIASLQAIGRLLIISNTA